VVDQGTNAILALILGSLVAVPLLRLEIDDS
jgi:hypothetical protein